MARDTAIAGASCGPPMTVMPTRSNRSLSSARKVAVMKSRSTLPSMIWLAAAMVRSSAADRCSRARGNRALPREVMVGLIRRMRGRWNGWCLGGWKVAGMKLGLAGSSRVWEGAAIGRSRAAGRCSRARGKRAIRGGGMVGLSSRMRGRWGMRRPSGWLASSRAAQPQYQGDGHLECGGVEMRARGNVGRVQHGFAHLFDLQADRGAGVVPRSEEHTSELQSLMRISYAVFCLKKKKKHTANKS